jgi:deazaflavin-dependent oxidoreductase (nitroreductase family)
MTDWDPESFTRNLIEDMRTHDGVPSTGHFAGRKLLILNTKGARSGQPRTAVLAYREDSGRWSISASKGGAPVDPAWLRNLEANPDTVTIEVNNEVISVRPVIETDGPERDRLWEAHVEEMPGFGEYPAKTDRVIPMILLEPGSPPTGTA